MILEILQAVIPGLAVVAAAIIAYRKDVRLKVIEAKFRKQNDESKDTALRSNVLDKLMDFESYNAIRDSVEHMFQNTKAERFLILIAINGTSHFNTISVIFEQQKVSKYKVNAIIRYRNIAIDDDYRNLLKKCELENCVDIDVKKMKTPKFLRDTYIVEKIKHSKIRFLHRQQLDDKNDVILFSSLATLNNEPFTDAEDAIIKMEYETNIIETIKEYI